VECIGNIFVGVLVALGALIEGMLRNSTSQEHAHAAHVPHAAVPFWLKQQQQCITSYA
jgi:hypothetical protein